MWLCKSKSSCDCPLNPESRLRSVQVPRVLEQPYEWDVHGKLCITFTMLYLQGKNGMCGAGFLSCADVQFEY